MVFGKYIISFVTGSSEEFVNIERSIRNKRNYFEVNKRNVQRFFPFKDFFLYINYSPFILASECGLWSLLASTTIVRIKAQKWVDI